MNKLPNLGFENFESHDKDSTAISCEGEITFKVRDKQDPLIILRSNLMCLNCSKVLLIHVGLSG